jgi:hypothetical protein
MEEFFKEVGDSCIFIGNKLEIFLPDRYEQHGCLAIGDEVMALGVFDMKINDDLDAGYYLPAKIAIKPSNVELVTLEGDRYVKLTLNKNDVFIKNLNVVQDQQLAYVIFYEIIYGGKTPKFLTYESSAQLFDTVSSIAKVNFPTDHVIFEMMTAMLHRDQDDITKQYRHTDQKRQPLNIPMRLTSHAAISTTSRIVGAYMDDGIDASLVNQSDVTSDIEDLLRR